ncbi:hypothetical protein [Streptomyces poriticola]|uniref:hypothetical protein n=1 Tax=Streptomyces poriticola TaxID=3120506 RepID=UPI002FCE1A57
MMLLGLTSIVTTRTKTKAKTKAKATGAGATAVLSPSASRPRSGRAIAAPRKGCRTGQCSPRT